MKFRSLHILPAALAAMAALYACDDSGSTVGSSLTGAGVEIVIDSSFTVTGKSVPVHAIYPKTTQQLIGAITVPEYGTLRSDFVAQFLPSTQLDTEDFTADNIDSLIMTLRYGRGSFIGDSVAPMGMDVYSLTKQLTTDISSGFNPEGYYNTTPLATKIYNTSTLNGTTLQQVASYRDINIKLPLELGRELFNAYVANPSAYADGDSFARDVFPGIYVRNSYGSGRMTLVSLCAMTMHMRKIYIPEGETELDTLDAEHLYYRVTPEVISNNNLSYTMAPSLQKMLDEGKPMLIAPTGSEIEFTLPLEDILAKVRATGGQAVINGMALRMPVDTIANDFHISAPPYVLMVLKKDRDEFFAKNKLPDNVTSFYTSYDKDKRRYNFSSLRSYLMEMLDRESITPDDYTFSLVPVQVNYENLVNSYYSSTQETTESEVLPYLVSPAMAHVKLDEAQIKLTYSLQTQK